MKISIDPEEELHEVFCIFDQNSDGFITADELYEMLKKLGESITVVRNCTLTLYHTILTFNDPV